MYLLTDEKEYFWPLPDSMIYANGVKRFRRTRPDSSGNVANGGGLARQAQCGYALRQRRQRIRMDFCPKRFPYCYPRAEPKMARIMAGGKHMGRGSQERGAVGAMVNQWLKEKLA